MVKYANILNYGAGVNSTALLILVANGHIKDIDPLSLIVLFADTGAEQPETYEYIPIIADYCTKKGMKFEIIKAKYTLEEYVYKSGILPSRSMRWCTNLLKIRPIGQRASMADIEKPYGQLVGFDLKEIKRIKHFRSTRGALERFPLVEIGLARGDCISIIRDENLPTPVKSRCFCCPFQSLSSFVLTARKYPELAYKTSEMELWTNLKRDGRNPFYLFREPISSIIMRADEILKRASRKGTLPDNVPVVYALSKD